MRRLRPNSQGIFVPQTQPIIHAGQVKPYTKPNPTLQRIDRLLNGENPNICLTRIHGGAGDLLMITPLIRTIYKKYGVKVDFGTDFSYLEGILPKCLQHNPYINQIIPWKEIDKEKYDAVVDLTCPCVAHEVPQAKPINRVDLFGRHVGVQIESGRLDYFVTEEEIKQAKQYIKQNFKSKNKKLVFIQHSASSQNRTLPHSTLKECIKELLLANRNIIPIIPMYKSDTADTQWVYKDIHLLQGFDIRMSAAIMSQCDLIICQDSLILHLANALKLPTFTFFGPTDPYARVNYHPEAIAYWPAGELKQFPIWYTNPPGWDICWKRIEVSVAVKTILAMLEGNALPVSRNMVTFGPWQFDNENYEII